MTEEDQKLVALAALHGARFYRREPNPHGSLWSIESIPEVTKWTLGRAAEWYLWKNGLRSDAEHVDYNTRTDVYSEAQEIDATFLESALA